MNECHDTSYAVVDHSILTTTNLVVAYKLLNVSLQLQPLLKDRKKILFLERLNLQWYKWCGENQNKLNNSLVNCALPILRLW